MKGADPREELEIMRHELAEPDARIDGDAFTRDTGGGTGRDARLEIFQHLDQRGIIDRIALHRPRLAAHMHQHDRCSVAGDDSEALRIVRQRRDVVDDAGTGGERRLHRGAVPGIDRDDRARSCEGAHDRLDTPDFLAGQQSGGSGAGRLAADIENVGTCFEKCTTVRGGSFGLEPLTPIREAVGSYVDDPHDDRPVEGKPRPRRPLRRQAGELLARAPREASAGTCDPRLELGNRCRQGDQPPVGSEPDRLYQG